MSDLLQISSEQAVKLIAMYLPQFHAIPENDRWWGEGFTEWTNVRKAKPLFPGHHQPHVPGRLGYYDLRDPAVRQSQADLAREYGIHGFCYYHYWFNGKRLLDTPFNEVLASGKPDFPFCLCWANENWTRAWDGLDREVLMAQEYGDADSVAFIRDLFPAFRDERYIRVNGKPLLLVYRTGLLPDPQRTTTIWREEMHRAGLGDLFLVRVENYVMGAPDPDPREVGFDAAMEFAPYWKSVGSRLSDLPLPGQPAVDLPDDLNVFDYDHCLRTMMQRPLPPYRLFRGIFPAWDNAARRSSGATLFINNSPAKYALWLATMLRQTMTASAGDERLLFINAWNEWGEGCHLEPDKQHGTAFLEATRLARELARRVGPLSAAPGDGELDWLCDAWYEGLRSLWQGGGVAPKTLAVLLGALAGDGLPTGPPSGDSRPEHDRLQEELAIARREIAALRSSLSWRLTAPLRRLANCVKRVDHE